MRLIKESSDPYPLPRPTEITVRIGMKKKKCMAALDFKHSCGSMDFCEYHANCMAVITPVEFFIPTRLGFRGTNESAKMQSIANHFMNTSKFFKKFFEGFAKPVFQFQLRT